MRLLRTLAVVSLAVLLLGCALQLFTNLGILLTVSPLIVMLIMRAYRQGYLLPGVRLEFLVDTHFVIAGLVTLLWVLIGG